MHARSETAPGGTETRSLLATQIASSLRRWEHRDTLTRLSRWLVIAALLEFLLLRVLIRLGPMLPPRDEIIQMAEVVILLGMAMLNVAVIIGVLGLLRIGGSTASRLLRWLLIGGSAMTLVRLSPGQSLIVGDLTFLTHSSLLLAIMTVALCITQASLIHKAFLFTILATYALLAYPLMGSAAVRLGWPWPAIPGTIPTIVMAEALAVLSALLVLFVFRPGRRWGLLAATLFVTMLFGAAWWVRPWIMHTFTQWTVGFTGSLSVWLYLLGITGFVYTALWLMRGNGERKLFGWGLLLIALGGLRWDYTYFNLLSLMGYLLLAQPFLPTRRAHETDMNSHPFPTEGSDRAIVP